VLGSSTRSRSRPKILSGSRPKMGRDPKKYPIVNQTRSRPELNDRFEIFWVATRKSVAIRSIIFYCFHQAVYPDKFSEKFLGRDPKNFLGRNRLLNFWPDPVATYGSMVPNTNYKTKP
jgi:hypothetical protein